MLKPIKKVYFWIKSKVNKMITKNNLSSLQDRKNKLTESIIMASNDFYVSNYVDIDLPITNYEQIDFKIALDKFSIYIFLDVSQYKIYFKTYYWEFNPNILGNFSKKHLENFDIIAFEDDIKIINIQRIYKINNEAVTLFIHYFGKIHSYIVDVHKAEIEKIEQRIV